MRARAQLTASAPLATGGPPRLTRRRDEAPVAWRATPEAVYLVGTAASPVGHDDVSIDVAVEPDAVLHVRSAAATVGWRGSGTAQHLSATVSDRGLLDWHLEPLIATAGCQHRQYARIQLHGRAQLIWGEEVLLGRYGEEPGQLDLRLDVDLDGRPLLRHQVVLGPGAPAWDGPAVVGGARCLGLALYAGVGRPDGNPSRARDGNPSPSPSPNPSPAAGSGAGAAWALLDLEGPGTLILAVADDLPLLRHALHEAQPAVTRSSYAAP